MNGPYDKGVLSYLFKNRMFSLFDEIDWMNQVIVDLKWVNRFYHVSRVVGIKTTINLFTKTNVSTITKHNAKHISLFLDTSADLLNGKIEIKWGRGNHNNVLDNIEAHYKKHVLCTNEGIFWNKILDQYDNKNDSCCYSAYMNYAIDMFKIMMDDILK